MDNRKVIHEENITIRGTDYKQVTFENGETILKTFNKKYKMWIISKFSQKVDDAKIIENIINTATSVLN